MWTVILACAASAVAMDSRIDFEVHNTGFAASEPATEPPPAMLSGLLYPRESETREVKSLDGLWDFLKPSSYDLHQGHREMWFRKKLSSVNKVIKMPVPSSYNDITTSGELRDHVGYVWYEKSFFVPKSWKDQRVFLRFGSVNYDAQCWLNSILLGNHEIGHLPFEFEISNTLEYDGNNILTVVVDNTLLQTSIPQGKVVTKPSENGTAQVQTYTFDFFNYAGIQRSVLLHTKPKAYIDDVTLKTDIDGDTGTIKYMIESAGLDEKEAPVYSIKLLDAHSMIVLDKPGLTAEQGILTVPQAKLWWPRGMSEEPGYLYTMEITLFIHNTTVQDIYRIPVGIRTLKWTNTSLLINNKPLYLRGFGRHEDSALRGRGYDQVTMVRDYELLKWVGANAYRTSHYPYSDETLDMADRSGVLIIAECPSVDTENFSPTLLTKHKQSLSELIRRDKNHPSVIMWSIANEPRTQSLEAEEHFKKVSHHTKSLDPTRPITLAVARSVQEDRAGKFLDIISFNRYNAWYQNSGRLDMITNYVEEEATAWHQKYNKPVLMSEYGDDTMPGLHELPAFVWSEEYQSISFSKHFRAFDKLRKKGFFIGEFIWNFADFRTDQTYTRVGGNKKGIFTRDRQPKEAAYLVRKRYHELSAELEDAPIPDDLEIYTSSFKPGKNPEL